MVKRRTAMSDLGRDPESIKILQRSSVFHEFQIEKHEINKLKWLESEKTGRDIGYEKALFLWARAHRNPWRAARRRLNSKASK